MAMAPSVVVGRKHQQCPVCECHERHSGCLACYKRSQWPHVGIHKDCPCCFCIHDPLELNAPGTGADPAALESILAEYPVSEIESYVNKRRAEDSGYITDSDRLVGLRKKAEAEAQKIWTTGKCPGEARAKNPNAEHEIGQDSSCDSSHDSDHVSKPFKCTWCPARFKTLYDWERHEKVKYPQEAFFCPDQSCGEKPRIFKKEQHLKNHMKSVHKSTSFEGDDCRFTVKRDADFRYKCEQPWDDNDPPTLCNHPFAEWSKRVEHIKKEHHPKSNQEAGSDGDDEDGSGGAGDGPGDGPGGGQGDGSGDRSGDGSGSGPGSGPSSSRRRRTGNGTSRRDQGSRRPTKRPRTSRRAPFATGCQLCDCDDFGYEASVGTGADAKGALVKRPGVVSHELILSFSRILALRPSDPLPFVPAGRLGSGSYGTVDRVRWKGTNEVFARKTFSSILDISNFHREVEIMKKLPHHAHIVGFSGAYTGAYQSGILMRPVASHSLESYLRQPPPGRHGDDRWRWLSNQFSCLAAGLKTLHDRDIRHGDIKPANILISDGNIMLCDFGLSTIHHSPMPSDQVAMTKVYAPPEADCRGPRKGFVGKKSDIYAMGCVFLDIATWLCGRPVAEFREFRASASRSDPPDTSYHGNMPAVMDWVALLSHLRPSPPVPDVLDAVESMLSEDEAKRPDAHQLADRFPPFSCCVPRGERPIRVAVLDSGVDVPREEVTTPWPPIRSHTGRRLSPFPWDAPDGYSPGHWHRAAQAVAPDEVVNMSRRSMLAFLRGFDAQFSDCTMASDKGTRSSIRDDTAVQEELDALLEVESSKCYELRPLRVE